MPYSIGITTFMARYRPLFKSLVKRLAFTFPDTEIIVAVNGHYNQNHQKNYLEKITRYCQKYPNVKLVTYTQPVSLSKLWNQIIIASSDKKVLLLNDDILFRVSLPQKIEACGVLKENIALLNDSFSHFFIDKDIIAQNGWFDERFPEIGGEDDDFHVRLVLNGIELKRYYLKEISNYKPRLKINSYGKLTTEQAGSYSNSNTEFLHAKWDIKNTPFEGSQFVVKSQGNHWKLRANMETPNFYPHEHYPV